MCAQLTTNFIPCSVVNSEVPLLTVRVLKVDISNAEFKKSECLFKKKVF